MTALGNFSPSDVLTATDMNQLNNVTALYKSGTQAVATGVNDPVTFGSGTTVVDVSGWHSETTNNSRITPTVAGYYLITAGLQWAETALNTYIANVLKNGTDAFGLQIILYGSFFPANAGSAVIYMNGTTDYVEMIISTNSGITRTAQRFALSCTLLRKA